MSEKPTTADLLRWARGAEFRYLLAAHDAATRRDLDAVPALMLQTAELRGMVQTLATLRRMGAA